MPKYKVSVSKQQKKYSIVLSATSETEARKKVHAEGYTVLSVHTFSTESIKGHKFFFEAVDENGAVKKGQVVANDPFKVFVKLKEGLGYEIKFLYSESNIHFNEGQKLDLVTHLNEQYKLYIGHKNKTKTNTEKKTDIKNEKKNLESFYMKKELDQTYRLIDFVVIKLKNILDKADGKDIDPEKREKLQKLHNSIITIRKSTNITRLRQIGELALTKIGEIELSILETHKDGNSEKLLKETNNLLKKLGSKEKIVEKDSGLGYQFQKLFESLSESIAYHRKSHKRKPKENIDKESLSYWKTEVLINKYQDRKDINTKAILKKFYILLFPFGNNREVLNALLLRRKVVNQNITILKAKKTGKLVSYTKIVKGYYGAIYGIVVFLKYFNGYIYNVIFLFGLLFGIYLLLVKNGLIGLELNIFGIFAFMYLIISCMLVFLTRGIISFFINLALFGLFLMLGIVNF